MGTGCTGDSDPSPPPPPLRLADPWRCRSSKSVRRQVRSLFHTRNEKNDNSPTSTGPAPRRCQHELVPAPPFLPDLQLQVFRVATHRNNGRRAAQTPWPNNPPREWRGNQGAGEHAQARRAAYPAVISHCVAYSSCVRSRVLRGDVVLSAHDASLMPVGVPAVCSARDHGACNGCGERAAAAYASDADGMCGEPTVVRCDPASLAATPPRALSPCASRRLCRCVATRGQARTDRL